MSNLVIYLVKAIIFPFVNMSEIHKCIKTLFEILSCIKLFPIR